MDPSPTTRLRLPRADDLPVMDAWRHNPSSPFDDWTPNGSADPRDERLPRPDGVGQLIIADAGDLPIGAVQWHTVRYGPTAGSLAMNIGISLRPESRGQGHGSRAQSQLADYLIHQLGAHRVEAGTDVENVAEQRALERAGFIREGVVRGAQWRKGQWHDLVLYSRLHTDDTR
jgi:RimJ/RimL family protein N-acetyltransferase